MPDFRVQSASEFSGLQLNSLRNGTGNFFHGNREKFGANSENLSDASAGAPRPAHVGGIGDRTRQLDHAYVEFCRGIMNLAVHRAEGTHGGGVHLEMTGQTLPSAPAGRA